MADQSILIEFRTDIAQLVTAIDKLEELSLVDKETAASFRKTKADLDTYNKSLSDSSQKINKVTIETKEIAKALKELPVVQKAMAEGQNAIGKETDKLTTKTITLKTELRQLKEQMAQLEIAGKANTREFQQLSQKAGELQNQIGDVGQRTKNLASDTKNLDAALSVATGVAGTFAVAQGAAALFGDENEEIQKTLLKVQAALAIVNGLQAVAATVNKDSAISTALNNFQLKQGSVLQTLYAFAIGRTTAVTTAATVATRVFRTALLLTGVGAVIVLLAAAANAMGFFSSETEDATDSINEQNDALDEQNRKLKEQFSIQQRGRDSNINKLQRELDLRKTQGADDEALFKLENEIIEERIDKARILAATLETGTQDQIDAEQQVLDLQNEQYILRASLLIKQKEDEKKASEEGADRAEKLTEDQLRDRKAAIERQLLFEKDFNDRSLELKKQLVEAEKNIALNQEGLTPNEIGLIKDKAKQESDIIQEQIDAYKATQLEPISLIEPKDVLETTLIGNLKLIENFDDKLRKINFERKEKQEEDAEDEKQSIRDLFDLRTSAALDLANTLGQISQFVLDKELSQLDQQLAKKQITQEAYDKKVLEAKRKNAIQNKALAIFETIISTAQGVVTALAQPPGVPATIPFGILAGILGAAQIALIAAQPLPFAKGTRRVTGGEQGKDSVHALLMPGEGVMPTDINTEYDPILSAIHKRKIPSDFLNSLANMSLPDFGGMLSMMQSGMAVPVMGGIDYEKMADAFGKKIEGLPIAENYFDEDGFHRSVRTKTTRTEYLNKRYRRDQSE